MKQPFAYIHPAAKIHPSVVIDPFVTIDQNVEIGEGTHIGSNVTIMEGARIGKYCNIFPGAVISGIPQDLKFKGEDTVAIIGDHTTIRECATVNRGTASKDMTRVGSNCLIMAYCHVAHDCVIGDNVIMSNACQVAGEVQIDDYAVIGGGTLIHQFRDPIAYTGVNSIGLRRRNFSNDQIREIQEIYRYLYLSRLNVSDAVDRIEAEIAATKERDEIIEFIRNSRRGIVRGYV